MKMQTACPADVIRQLPIHESANVPALGEEMERPLDGHDVPTWLIFCEQPVIVSSRVAGARNDKVVSQPELLVNKWDIDGTIRRHKRPVFVSIQSVRVCGNAVSAESSCAQSPDGGHKTNILVKGM